MSSLFFILILFGLEAHWQEPASRPAAAERGAQIIKRLETEKTKIDCKKNDSECWVLEWFISEIRGNQSSYALRSPWMEKMQKLGVKQVSFELEFAWKGDSVHFKFSKIDYFQEYCLYKSRVKDWKLLHRIKKEGLEDDLKEAAVSHLKKHYGTYQEGNVKRGEDNLTLFDDEALPQIQWIY